MNRLTKVESSSVLIKDGWKKKDTESYTSICYGCEEIGRCVNKCGFYKALEKLADYEDLEEQGLLIKLPSIPKNKTLYWIWGKEIMPVQFKGISHGAFNKKKEFHILCKMATKKDRTFTNGKAESTYKKGDIRYFYADEIGKTIFLTREEAEKAFKGMEEK